MSAPDPAADAPLEFDGPGPATGVPACSSCHTPITDQYWSIGQAVLCAGCREPLEQGRRVATDVTSRTARFTRSLVYGLGGTLLGAGVWYAVAKLADLEVGLIAILLGFLVGKAVFVGSGKRGGRRYQVLAVLLTYLGIGMAYAPFAIEAMRKSAATRADSTMASPAARKPAGALQGAELAQEEARLDSVLAAGGKPAETLAPRPAAVAVGVVALLGVALLGILTLPVIVTIGGLPGSLISLLIYGFALMEAWKLTREVRLPLTGPFRVGGPTAA